MAMWHCLDRCSGERFTVRGGDEDAAADAVEAYIRDGIDDDTGEVDYDVVATAVDGSEYSLSGTVRPRVSPPGARERR